jgi:hypothetical protein
MAIDLRTRTDGSQPAVVPDQLLGHQLPAAFARHAQALAELWRGTRGPLLPLELRVEDDVWTFTDDDALHVRPGECDDDRTTRLRVTPEQLANLANDHLTPIGLWTSGSLDLEGHIGQVLDWWLRWRAALDGPMPPFDPAELPDDLTRSFTLDDDPAEIRTFLEQAGFAHLRGVFTEQEMAAISADMDREAPGYHPGDDRSWWAETTDGPRLVRMQRFDERSAATAALLTDPRFLGLGELTGAGHRQDHDRKEKIEALFKPIGVIEGISDIPWHKDCSLGRHSYRCSALTVGVSVTGAGPTTGQLRVIAGSHRMQMWPALLDVTRLPLPDVALATETGDITLHLSCTLHMAQPPTERERRVLYTSFELPPLPGADLEFERAVLRAAREAAPVTVTQPAAV